MEEDLGELNWVSASGGGKLLTVPVIQWEKYVDVVKTEHRMQRNHERGLQKRATRVAGGIDGRWAEFSCYTTGVFGEPQSSTFTSEYSAACDSFYYTSGSSPIQVWAGSADLRGVWWVFKFENWGKLNYAWNAAKCKDVLSRGRDVCTIEIDGGRGGFGSGLRMATQGGWIDVYTGLQQNTQTRGDKALAFTFDPTS